MKKKIICMLMTLIMMLSCLPVSAFAESGTVHYEGQHSYDGTITGYFSVDGTKAFCAQHEKATPQTGHSVTYKTITNTLLAKALYYGWGGQEQWSGFKSKDEGVVVTSIVCSDAYAGESTHEYGAFQSFKNYIKSKPLVGDGTVTVGVPSSSHSDYQILAIQYAVKTGNLTLVKSSADKSITSGNSNYSLSGAVYRVYKNYTDGKVSGKVGELTTKSDGTSNTLKDLVVGTYYVKEYTAPKGFKKDSTVHSIKVTASNTASDAVTLKVSDTPQTGSVKLTKESTNTDISKASSSYSLAGAVYGVYKTYSDGKLSGKVGELTTKSSGTSNTLSGLAIGKYYAKELTAPKGFALNDKVYSATVEAGKTATFAASDKPETTSVTLVKSSGNTKITKNNDCYSLTGAVYGVYKNYTDGKVSGKVGELTTKSDGTANTISGLPLAPYYYAKELTAPKGMALDTTVYKVKASTPATATVIPTFKVKDQPQSDPLGVLLKKVDADTGKAVAVGDGSLAGAEYTVKYYDGQYKTADEAKASGSATRTWVLKTDKDGEIYFEKDYLVSGTFYTNSSGQPTIPLGTITIQETKAPAGYLIDKTIHIRNITSNGTLEAVKSYNVLTVSETPIKGSIEITKHTQTGLLKLDVPEVGAKFQVYLKSAGSYAKAAETERDQLTINAFGKATTKDLPYGTYTVHQTESWKGSKLAPDFDITISTDGQVCKSDVVNERFYSYLKIIKIDSITDEAIPVEGIGFQIYLPDGTLLEKDNENTWYSDVNGVVSIPVELEYGEGYKAVEMNAPDGYVLAAQPFTFDVNEENATSEDGLTTITLKAKNTPTTVQIDKIDPDGNPVVGATLQVLNANGTVVDEWVSDGTGHTIRKLSIGSKYTLHEAAAPEGYILADDVNFTIKDTTDTQYVSMENEEIPEIHTTATVDNNDVAVATENVTLIDTVTYEKLVPGREYTVSGKLTDKATGDPVLVDGKEITSSTTFTAEAAEGSVDVTFVFDATGLAGHSTVVFEDLYRNGKLYCTHASIDDEDQTVHFPEIGTTATVEDSHVAMATEDVTLIDTVAYKNLVPGREYTVSGKLMDKSTGEALLVDGKEITSTATFTAEAAEGSVDVTFVFDATGLKNNSTVVYEDMYDGEILVATHASIDDEGQTVHFPEIGTTATVDGSHVAMAKKDVTLIDTVAYKNLVPGKEYTVSGKLMDKSTGEALLVDGKEITSTATFTAEAAEGSVDVTFVFDATGLKNNSTVVYEDMYDGEILVATHASIDDEGQTVHFPEIGTTATVDGKHNVTAAREITLIDTVAYKNLVPGKEYTVSGKLMDKSTGKALLVRGKEITSTATFTAEAAEGTVDVTFKFNAIDLGGHDVVVFEDMYDGNILIATHADINSSGQTVHIDIPPTPPKTGDGGIMAYAAMGGISMLGAALTLYRKRREDEQ